MTNAPAISEALVGCASNTKTIAKINPKGTRMRRATRDQVSLVVGEGCDPDCETPLIFVLQDEVLRLTATVFESRPRLRRPQFRATLVPAPDARGDRSCCPRFAAQSIRP